MRIVFGKGEYASTTSPAELFVVEEKLLLRRSPSRGSQTTLACDSVSEDKKPTLWKYKVGFLSSLTLSHGEVVYSAGLLCGVSPSH